MDTSIPLCLKFEIMAYNNREGGPGGGGGYNRNNVGPNKQRRATKKANKRDPLFVDGVRPRPMYVDYKDMELLSKLTNRHGRIVSRRKSGCTAASQHAVSQAIKRARFMALMPYVGD